MRRGMFVLLFLLAASGISARAEPLVVPSDEDLLASADYCVVGTLTENLLLRVDIKVFGGVTAETLSLRQLLNGKKYKPGMVCVVYLVQDGNEIHSRGVREVRKGQVITSDLIEKDWFSEVTKNKTPSPAELERYVAEVKKREEAVRTERHKDQDEALDKIASGQLYAAKNWNAVHDILNGVLYSVHADDTSTLARMDRFIQERPQPLDMHARNKFIGVIARKNYKGGFDSIRLEASRNSRGGQNWASERAAIHSLARMGAEGDIELLRKIILVQGERGNGTLLHAAFPAFATLVVRYRSDEPAVLAKEIKWVNDHQFASFKKALSILKRAPIKGTEPKDALDKK